MCAQLNDLSPELLEVVIDVGDFLLLLQVGGLEVTQTAIHLNFEVSLQLLHVLHDRLLLPVQMCNRLLVLALNELNDIFSLTDHSVVFIVEFLHAEYVVGAGLLGQL